MEEREEQAGVSAERVVPDVAEEVHRKVPAERGQEAPRVWALCRSHDAHAQPHHRGREGCCGAVLHRGCGRRCDAEGGCQGCCAQCPEVAWRAVRNSTQRSTRSAPCSPGDGWAHNTAHSMRNDESGAQALHRARALRLIASAVAVVKVVQRRRGSELSVALHKGKIDLSLCLLLQVLAAAAAPVQSINASRRPFFGAVPACHVEGEGPAQRSKESGAEAVCGRRDADDVVEEGLCCCGAQERRWVVGKDLGEQGCDKRGVHAAELEEGQGVERGSLERGRRCGRKARLQHGLVQQADAEEREEAAEDSHPPHKHVQPPPAPRPSSATAPQQPLLHRQLLLLDKHTPCGCCCSRAPAAAAAAVPQVRRHGLLPECALPTDTRTRCCKPCAALVVELHVLHELLHAPQDPHAHRMRCCFCC